jgi:hypothetical protein
MEKLTHSRKRRKQTRIKQENAHPTAVTGFERAKQALKGQNNMGYIKPSFSFIGKPYN